MSYYKNRLEKVYKEIYKDNHKFYLNKDLKLKDLKELFRYYRNLDLNKNTLYRPIFYCLSLLELLMTLFGIVLFMLIVYAFLNYLNIKESFLYTSIITLMLTYCIYNLILKEGIRIFFDQEAYPDHTGELIAYMIRKKHTEEKNIIYNLNSDNEIKNNVKKRRL